MFMDGYRNILEQLLGGMEDNPARLQTMALVYQIKIILPSQVNRPNDPHGVVLPLPRNPISQVKDILWGGFPLHLAQDKHKEVNKLVRRDDSITR